MYKIFFDSYDIKESYLLNRKKHEKIPDTFEKKYGVSLFKKLKNLDEKLDITYQYNQFFRQYIPILKKFNFLPSKYNDIQLYYYSFYNLYDNGDEILVEINIEKELSNNKWVIESTYDLFLGTHTDKQIISVLTDSVSEYNHNFQSIEEEKLLFFLKEINQNLNEFFSIWTNRK